jgi:hypothetical protein
LFTFGGERPREQDAVGGARLTIEIGADFGLSRTFDDPGPPAELAPLVSLGILARSEPETGRLHQKCGRTR